jgi:hypothetical protein
MAGLALGMAGSIVLTGLFTAAWPMVAMGLVGAVLSATAMSWHGILLSETARLAPFGSAGAVTGGVLSFGQIGALLGPSVFALLLGVTGGYSIGWALCAVPALWVGMGMTDEDCPWWILSALRVAAYPIRTGPASARTCRNGSTG